MYVWIKISLNLLTLRYILDPSNLGSVLPRHLYVQTYLPIHCRCIWSQIDWSQLISRGQWQTFLCLDWTSPARNFRPSNRGVAFDIHSMSTRDTQARQAVLAYRRPSTHHPEAPDLAPVRIFSPLLTLTSELPSLRLSYLALPCFLCIALLTWPTLPGLSLTSIALLHVTSYFSLICSYLQFLFSFFSLCSMSISTEPGKGRRYDLHSVTLQFQFNDFNYFTL